MVVGFQGEPAAFSDDAARLLVPGAETRGYPSFEELLEAANTQAVDLALLPVENSIYGAIARSYDLLGSYSDLTIVDEIVYRVVQTLIGTPDLCDQIPVDFQPPNAARSSFGAFASAGIS